MKPFANRLRAAIKDAGLSIPQFAKLADIDGPNIYKFLRGETEPAMPTLRRMLRQLPMTDARWFVCGRR